MDTLASVILQIRQDTDSGSDADSGSWVGEGTGSSVDSNSDKFLKLIQDPFKSVFQENAFWAALGTSFGVAALTTLLFSVLRPRNSTVYAPRLKFGNSKNAPPAIGRSLFAWIPPILKSREPYLAERIGLDAAIFLRFVRMCRNMFLVLSFFGLVVLIPANVAGRASGIPKGYSNLTLITPLLVFGKALWAQVVCSWMFNVIIAGFLWWNYKKVIALRRAYLDSPEYQNTLHARTLMVTELPKLYQSDDGLDRVIEEVRSTPRPLHCSVARNVKELPKLKKLHDETNAELEGHVIAYINKLKKNANAPRPMCSPPKDDKTYSKGHKVDAIDYYVERQLALRKDIVAVRETLDNRDAMPYGFASYESINQAHAVAFSTRKAHPQGSNIALAPKPNDLIWENLPLDKKTRRWNWFTNTLWVAVLTVIWVVPNALMAIFLTNLSNLGNVWPGFEKTLDAHPHWWAAVQGIASPAISSVFYLLLPAIFRRLATRAGKLTKTDRDRQVIHQLFAFFVFNNLVVFTVFSTVWAFVAAVVNAEKGNKDVWAAIKQSKIGSNLAASLCNTSPYWVTWLLQRNLGAAIDISQAWKLIWIWFSKRFRNPTPRQLIEWTSPPPFDYANYYNYFLFYATVTLCFATLQPIVLLVTALYFSFDSYLKKYLLMYIFVTKTESAGQFWRVIYNRMVFAAIMGNIVVLVFVLTKQQYVMAFVMVPAPFVMLGFKWWCWKTFDDRFMYYNKSVQDAEALMEPSKHKGRHDKLGIRFGHPALTEPLRFPMIKEHDAQVFHTITHGRFLEEGGPGVVGESEGIPMHNMSATRRGKSVRAPGFELVPEGQLDFSYFKDRPEFAEESGEIYGRPADLVSERSTTPLSFMGGPPYRRGYDSPASSRGSSPARGPYSRVPMMKDGEAIGGNARDYRNHPAFRDAGSRSQSPGYRGAMGDSRSQSPGYRRPVGGDRSQSPAASHSRNQSRGFGDLGDPTGQGGSGPGSRSMSRGRAPYQYEAYNESESGLLRSAAGMPREESLDRYRTNQSHQSGPYAGIPLQDPGMEVDDPYSYDYYRGRR